MKMRRYVTSGDIVKFNFGKEVKIPYQNELQLSDADLSLLEVHEISISINESKPLKTQSFFWDLFQ